MQWKDLLDIMKGRPWTHEFRMGGGGGGGYYDQHKEKGEIPKRIHEKKAIQFL